MVREGDQETIRDKLMNAVAYSIVGLFGLTISCVSFLKWSDPNIDATFLGVLASMVMGMAAFLALHFKIEKNESNTITVAEKLKEQNQETLDKQTAKLTRVIDDLSHEIKEGAPPLRRK